MRLYHNVKTMIRLFSFFLFLAICHTQTIIGDGMTGHQLLQYVVDNYKTTSTLGYGNARDILYGTIDIQENDELSCVYSGFTITLDTTQDPSTNAYNQGINCEHSWPQSMGADEEPQKSDLHHLYPCKSNVNSSRGNHPYSDIQDNYTNTWYRNDYSQETIPADFIDEYAEKINGSDPAFEPREDHKGNAARAMFYFFAMYNDEADTSFWFIQKNTLIDWHVLDPIDENEIERTWEIASYQENHPNPFIIDSSLARRIWFVDDSGGGSQLDTFSLINPYNGMSIPTISPSFIWHAATDIGQMDTAYYTLIIDTQEPGILNFDARIDTSFSLVDTLSDNTQYFWQIIAEDMNGNQIVNQNGYHTFYTNIENEAPGHFTLIAPINESIQSLLNPNLYWTISVDPDPLDQISYIVSLNANNSIEWQNIQLDTNSYTPSIHFMDNSTYHWFVTSSDLNGEQAVSDTLKFYTDLFPDPPQDFHTISPTNSASDLAPEVEFIWNAAFDPDPIENIQYQLVYVTNLHDWEDTSSYHRSEWVLDTVIAYSFESNNQYYWSIIAKDSDGFEVFSNGGDPNELTIGVLGSENIDVPKQFSLDQNFPNPFNPTTKIPFEIPNSEFVNLNIYDVSGRKIRSLISENKPAGSYTVIWNGRNNENKFVSAGIYVYKIMAGNFISSRKVILIK